jgi:hypothetical protein
MENKVSLILKVFAAVVSVIAIILVMVAGSSNTPEVGSVIALTEVLFFIAIAATIIFPIMIIAQDPKKGITFLIGAVGLAVIFGIAYGMSTDEVINGEVVENSRIAEAGIITFYILFFVAVAALLLGSVKKLIK